MGIFNVNDMQAQDHALEQRLNETKAFIASALRAFPAAARQMGTPLHEVKFNLLRKKQCYFLAFDGEITETGEFDLDLFGSRGVIFTDGTYCFANSGITTTEWSGIVTSAESFAAHLMRRFAEFRDMASARRIFESALRGAYAELRGTGQSGLRRT